MLTMFRDGMINALSGIGLARSKAGSVQHTAPDYNPAELLAAYQSSSLIRRAVDLPAEDSVREWREWQGEADQISDLEAEEKRLGLKLKVYQARQRARLFGGAAILIGADTSNPMEPLKPSRIGREGIEYLTLLAREEIVAGEADRDVASPTFGRPTSWRINGTETGILDVHPTRLAIFSGVPTDMSPLVAASHGYWGTSVLSSMVRSLNRVLEGAENANSLLYEAKVDILGISNFMEDLRSLGKEYEDAVQSRVELMNRTKGLGSLLVMDKEDVYEQKSASFGGIPDVLAKFMEIASAEAGLPVTLLFGTSPGGLNSTGESDVRNYYDRVRTQQTLHMEPAMQILDEATIVSALGSRPEEIHYNWKPLWQETTKEKAENADKITSAAERVSNLRAIPTEALGKAVVNALTESGAFPGLEGAVAEYYAENPGEVGKPIDEIEPGDVTTRTSAEPPANTSTAPRPRAVGDAEPRPLYVRRDVTNVDEIRAWAEEQGIEIRDDLHVTIAYSKTPIDPLKIDAPFEETIEVRAGGPREIEWFGEAMVLSFRDWSIEARHREIREAGASWDHETYQPHVTLKWQAGGDDGVKLKPYNGRIVFGPEIFEDLDEEWKP